MIFKQKSWFAAHIGLLVMSDIFLLASKCIYAQQSNALIEVQGKSFVYMECYKLSTGNLLLCNDTPIFMELQMNNIWTHIPYIHEET